MDNQKSSRFLVKLNIDAVRANNAKAHQAIVSRIEEQGENADKEALAHELQSVLDGTHKDVTIPVWLVLNSRDYNEQSPWQCLFVWDFRAREIAGAFGAHNSPSGPSVFATDDLEVQLQKGGEFVNLSVALESGAASWGLWQTEYLRVGVIEEEQEQTPVLAREGAEA